MNQLFSGFLGEIRSDLSNIADVKVARTANGTDVIRHVHVAVKDGTNIVGRSAAGN